MRLSYYYYSYYIYFDDKYSGKKSWQAASAEVNQYKTLPVYLVYQAARASSSQLS